MPINVFGNSSNNSDNKNDTSLFVQKPYLGTKYIEANFEEDIDLKNQNRIKNLPDPISIREPAPKNYFDNLFNDSSIVKSTAHIDLNDRNITNARFIQVNQLPQIDSHLTAKLYVDNPVDESSLVRINQDNDFNSYNLTKINSITLNKQAENGNEIITKAYVDQFHQENEQSRRHLGIDLYDESSDLVKNNQDNDFIENKLTNSDSITVNRNSTSDNELSTKKYIDDQLDKKTFLRFNQTLENSLRISVGNDTYVFTKFNKTHITDTTIIKAPNSGKYLLQQWNLKCNDRKGNGKIQGFVKSTKSSSPTQDSGATVLTPIGDSFMYFETSSNSNGDGVYGILERTDIIPVTNITFYYNRFLSSDIGSQAMGRFRIQLLIDESVWSSRFSFPKNSDYSSSSTECSLINLDFTEKNYGVRLFYDQIASANADMCFSNITITHSVY